MEADSSIKNDLPAKADISNKTIVVLVVLTVIICLLSTLIVVNEVNNFQFSGRATVGQTLPTSNNQGKVSFTIAKPEVTGATGKVVFNII